MVDKEKRETHPSGSGEGQPGSSVGIDLAKTDKPQSNGQHKKSSSSHKGHYGEYVIWIAILILWLVIPSFRVTREFFDSHSGLVSAIGTIAIMLLTIAYVMYSRRQWRIMSKQADIAAQQASIAETALRLQEASQRQWVDLRDWQVWLDKGKEDSTIRIRFHIANPTDIPLGLDRVTTTSKITGGIEKTQSSSNDEVLAPANPKIYDVSIPITHKESEHVKTFGKGDVVMMAVTGSIIFTDAGRTQWEQAFERYIWCDKSKFFGQGEHITPSIRQIGNRLKKIPT